MILRKPYAFFIRYFKLINLIMAILMCFLIYRTGVIANFFNEYINDYVTASNGFILGNYINVYSFILALFIVIFTVIVLSVLFVKGKPKKLYIFNLVLYVAIIILYGIDSGVLRGVNEAILDIRVSKAFRDITMLALGLQALSLVLTLIRATGFDIKGFNFGADLQELDIDTKDNEEFEVAVEFDKNKMKRNVRKNIRNIFHTYREHRFIINLIIIIIIIILTFLFFLNRSVYRADYKEGKNFQASGVVMNVKKSYITKTDQDGKQITPSDKSILIIKFDVKSIYQDDEKTLNTGLMTIKNENNSYGQTSKYNGTITDIGTPYTGQNLDTEFESYILAFEIPDDITNKNLTLKFNDNVSYVKGQMGAKSSYVKLKPEDLTDIKEVETENIKETLSFSGSILGNSELLIEDIAIDNKFKINYNFCLNKNKCYPSHEYVTPTATGNYFKTLMRINGNFEPDETSNLDEITDLYYFLNTFGTINYKIKDDWYSHKIDSKIIEPTTGTDNYYYIEVNQDIKNASEIYLTFKIRDYNYRYILK